MLSQVILRKYYITLDLNWKHQYLLMADIYIHYLFTQTELKIFTFPICSLRGPKQQ